MLYTEITAVCSQTYKTQKYIVWQNVELVNAKPGGAYSKHWAVKGELVPGTNKCNEWCEMKHTYFYTLRAHVCCWQMDRMLPVVYLWAIGRRR